MEDDVRAEPVSKELPRRLLWTKAFGGNDVIVELLISCLFWYDCRCCHLHVVPWHVVNIDALLIYTLSITRCFSCPCSLGNCMLHRLFDSSNLETRGGIQQRLTILASCILDHFSVTYLVERPALVVVYHRARWLARSKVIIRYYSPTSIAGDKIAQ